MDLSDRLSLILLENNLKQKELADLIAVSDGYISALITRRNGNLSNALANLIEAKLGYSSQWVLYGIGEKMKDFGEYQHLSDGHKRAMLQLQKLSDEQALAVLAFIDSLEKIEAIYSKKENNRWIP